MRSIQYQRFIKTSLFTLILAVFAFTGFHTLLTLQTAAADNPSGDLRIEVLTAYNLVVDSNVSAPSTFGPDAFTVGAKFCNDGLTDMTNVTAFIGDYVDGDPANWTPGTYPSRDSSTFAGEHDHLLNTGFYQFQYFKKQMLGCETARMGGQASQMASAKKLINVRSLKQASSK